ncbi:MAG TPA: signal peptidase II [Actinomycetes bacterium]|nr:signal peptidase II [Actinomycetes bacterium]
MRRRRLALVYGTALGVLAVDQLTKSLVVDRLAGRGPVEVLGSVVRLRYTTNTGGAFSLFPDFPLFFAFMAVAVAVAIALYARRVATTGVLLTLGLILGGALGNFTDRLLRGGTLLHGEVVDFIQVRPWPVFNVADSCITVGAVLLALVMGRVERPGRRSRGAGEPEPEAAAAAREHDDPGTPPAPAR